MQSQCWWEEENIPFRGKNKRYTFQLSEKAELSIKSQTKGQLNIHTHTHYSSNPNRLNEKEKGARRVSLISKEETD